MADRLSSISEMVKQASEAYVRAISTLSEAAQNLGGQAATDRDRMIENWLRLARMGKDGTILAIEQGFEIWEREVRRLNAQTDTAEKTPVNPMEQWAANWRKASETLTASGPWTEQFRKQAEAVQSTLAEGMRAWQNLWLPEKK